MQPALPIVVVALLAMAQPARAAIAPCHGTILIRPGQGREQRVELPPDAAQAAACRQGVRLVPEPAATLWRCPVEARTDEPPASSHALVVAQGPGRVQVFGDALFGGRLDAWRVVRADLDADGKMENIVATWNAQSNGLGVHSWTVRVFSDGWRLLATFAEVKDWGPNSIVAAGTGRCDLALSSYVEGHDGGLTLEVRFMRFGPEGMAESQERGPLRRRLTAEFQRQRSRTLSGERIEGDVVAWASQQASRRQGGSSGDSPD